MSKENKMNLLTIYESIIQMCNYIVDDRGQVRAMLQGDRSMPVITKVDDEEKSIYLPTKKNLGDVNVMGQIIFHPFVENLTRGESHVLTWIRKQFNYHYGQSISRLMLGAVQISVDSSKHGELDNEQTVIISKMGALDSKFVESFERILHALAKRSSKNSPAILSVRRGGKVNGVAHSRVARWSFPLIEEIMDAIEKADGSSGGSVKPSVFGVPVRKGDLPLLLKVVEVFFPNVISETDYWTGFSDGKDAPFAEAFLRAVYKLVTHTNGIALKLFGKGNIVDSEVDAMTLKATFIPVDFIGDDFEVMNWNKECLLIPMQVGNEGKEQVTESMSVAPVAKTNKWEDVIEAAPVAATPVPHPQQQPVNHQPVQYHQNNQMMNIPQASQAPTGMSYMEKLRAANNHNQPPAPQSYMPMTDQFGNQTWVPVQQHVNPHPAYMTQGQGNPMMAQTQANVRVDGFGRPLGGNGQVMMAPTNGPAPILGFNQQPAMNQGFNNQPQMQNGMVTINGVQFTPQQAAAILNQQNQMPQAPMGYSTNPYPNQPMNNNAPMGNLGGNGSSFNFNRAAFNNAGAASVNIDTSKY